MVRLQAQVLHPGSAQGETMVLEEGLSFWGGYDPNTGVIIDRHHPQQGQKLADKILLMPASRGSAGTPAGVAESVRQGTGPAGIILSDRDVNVAVGMMVANHLYRIEIPVLLAEPGDYPDLIRQSRLKISIDGTVESVD